MADIRITTREKRLEELAEQIEASWAQWGRNLNDGEKIILKREAESYEKIYHDLQQEIDQLKASVSQSEAFGKEKEDPQWNLLLSRIKSGKCTPFIGPGIHTNVPDKDSIARQLAAEHNYPLADIHDLARVTQFLAAKGDFMVAKEKFSRHLTQAMPPPDFRNPYEPHRILASLPLPLYITANVDDYMVQALNKRGGKKVQQEICRWYDDVRDVASIFDQAGAVQIDPSNPVVFHLYGCLTRGQERLLNSLVLTEDDYLDFLANLSEDQNLLPPRILKAFTSTSLLFLGFRVSDWDFRILMRLIRGFLKRSQYGLKHVSVQLVPNREGFSEQQKMQVQEYLSDYFDNLKIQVHWGSCQEFLVELKERWEVVAHED